MKGKRIAIALINAEQGFFSMLSRGTLSDTKVHLMECRFHSVQNSVCGLATLTHTQMAYVRLEI